LERKNILIIVIIAVLIVSIGIGVTLYEQQQVKLHLTKANAYHTGMMASNPQISNASSLKEIAGVVTKDKPFLTNELNELRAANTIFATQTQKDYINAAIDVNTANSKQFDIMIAASNTTNLSRLSSYVNDLDQIDKDRITSAGKRDSAIAAHPEEFGFEVVKL
jgi:hypothetical protein